MTRKDAIEAIKCNWPDSRYTILREALDMAVKALGDVTDKNVGKMTNADRIRAMSDEELATMLKDYKDCSKNCIISNGKHCYQICEEESVLLKWLQQSAEEDDHA